jgi:hypothetical protein
MGYAAGLEVALKEREAEVARLRAWGERFEQSFYDTSSKAAEYRAEIAALRRALRGLYEATHGYLNWGGDPRRLDVPADRLQDALVAAHALLQGDHER